VLCRIIVLVVVMIVTGRIVVVGRIYAFRIMAVQVMAYTAILVFGLIIVIVMLIVAELFVVSTTICFNTSQMRRQLLAAVADEWRYVALSFVEVVPLPENAVLQRFLLLAVFAGMELIALFLFVLLLTAVASDIGTNDAEGISLAEIPCRDADVSLGMIASTILIEQSLLFGVRFLGDIGASKPVHNELLVLNCGPLMRILVELHDNYIYLSFSIVQVFMKRKKTRKS
jgi:hypothetical protein